MPKETLTGTIEYYVQKNKIKEEVLIKHLGISTEKFKELISDLKIIAQTLDYFGISINQFMEEENMIKNLINSANKISNNIGNGSQQTLIIKQEDNKIIEEYKNIIKEKDKIINAYNKTKQLK